MGYLDLNNLANFKTYAENPDPFAKLYIYNNNSDNLAPVFQDDDLLNMAANPMRADEVGHFNSCFLAKGTYRIVVRAHNDGVLLDQNDVVVQSNIETNYVRSFKNVKTLLSDKTLSYHAGTGRAVVRDEALIFVSLGEFSYQIAPENATDYHIVTQGGVKLYVVPDDSGFNVVAFGTDNTGQSPCEAEFEKVAAAAHAARVGIFVPAGIYCVQDGIDFIGHEAISGYAVNLDVRGAGHESTIFFCDGAPDYAIRIDARYFTMSGFSVWGSRDQIRDSSHSAPIGIWVENMREGALSNFKVQHIVGTGLRIDRCIVSRIDGIVYRCGSDTARAVDQTVSDIDGCQASFVRLSCEDSHGAKGTMRWLSHRNTHIEAKLENQPYHICEISSAAGRAARDEVITFSGGATATVALASPLPSLNSKAQLVVKDVVGTITPAETFTASGGASGTVDVVTAPTGPQFESSGDYGVLDIFANQNALRTTGAELIFSKANAHTVVSNLALRDAHYGVGVSVTGSDYTFNRVFLSLGLTDVANEADYSYAMEITGRNNHVGEFYSENAKGIHFAEFAHRGKIDSFVQENLYGQSAYIESDDCEISSVDCAHAAYTDPGMTYTHAVRITGNNSRFGTGGGRLELSQTPATDNVVNLSGADNVLGPVDIQSAGSAGIAVFMSGSRTQLNGIKVAIANGAEGVRCAATDGQIIRPAVSGGAICVDLRADGAQLIGGTLSGYSTRAINAQPNSTVEAMRIQDVTCHTPNGTPGEDIKISTNATYSHIINNNTRRGIGAITSGSGVGNVIDNNIV